MPGLLPRVSTLAATDPYFVGIDPVEEEALIEELYDNVYADVIEEVDAADNGIPAHYSYSK